MRNRCIKMPHYLRIPSIFYHWEIDLWGIKFDILSFQQLRQLLLNFCARVSNVTLFRADLLAQRYYKELYFWAFDSGPERKWCGLNGAAERGAHYDRDAIVQRKLLLELKALSLAVLREHSIANEVRILGTTITIRNFAVISYSYLNVVLTFSMANNVENWCHLPVCNVENRIWKSCPIADMRSVELVSADACWKT